MELSQFAPAAPPFFLMKWWKWVTQMVIAWWFSLPWAHRLLGVCYDQSVERMGMVHCSSGTFLIQLHWLVHYRWVFDYSHLISDADITSCFYLMWKREVITVLGSKRRSLFSNAHRDSCFAAMMCIFHSVADSFCQLTWIMAPEAFVYHKPAAH